MIAVVARSLGSGLVALVTVAAGVWGALALRYSGLSLSAHATGRVR